MPELPDIETYIDAARRTLGGKTLNGVRVMSPFVLRSVEPPLQTLVGKQVLGAHRIGKRIVLEFESDLFLVVHLMIAGRLRWKPPGTKVNRKTGLAAFDFADGALVFTEASSKKRASLYVVAGRNGLAEHDPGGMEVIGCDPEAFTRALQQKNHTLKRALTDPRILSGIGNAYSDEILHRAQLSPVKWTSRLTPDEFTRLYDATQVILTEWTAKLQAEVGDGFPDRVTAFHSDMAVHGKYGQPCPVCQNPVQRIRRASNEVNYCAKCQTSGKLLADRGLSRLLKGDWPKTLEELEELKKDSS